MSLIFNMSYELTIQNEVVICGLFHPYSMNNFNFESIFISQSEKWQKLVKSIWINLVFVKLKNEFQCFNLMLNQSTNNSMLNNLLLVSNKVQNMIVIYWVLLTANHRQPINQFEFSIHIHCSASIAFVSNHFYKRNQCSNLKATTLRQISHTDAIVIML